MATPMFGASALLSVLTEADGYIVIPEEASFELENMGEEESAERELQARRIYSNRPNLSAGTEWTSSTDTVFDGKP